MTTAKELHPLAWPELHIWATEAVECPVCKFPWTPEAIEQQDARVISILPRKLACGECLIKLGAKAIRVELGLDDSQEGRKA